MARFSISFSGTHARALTQSSDFIRMLSKVPVSQKLGFRFASQVKAPVYNAFGAPTASNAVRPISPHTTIYKFPLPAITSIINRFTGVGLSLGKMFFHFNSFF